jgi:hypothetical protein
VAQHSAEASAFCSVLSNIAPRSERSGAAPTQASAFSRCPARIRLSRSLSLTQHRPAAHCPSWCPSRKSGAVPTSIKIAPRSLRAGAALSRCFSLLLGAHQDREVGRSTDLHHDRASLPTSKRSTQQMLQPSARCSSRSRLSPYEPAQHSAAASAFCSVLSKSLPLSLRESGAAPTSGIRRLGAQQDRASLPTSRRSTQQRHPPSARCSASLCLSLSVRVAQHRPAASAASGLSKFSPFSS